MEEIWRELSLAAGDVETIRIAIRLGAALLLGAVIGYERESAGKAAGLRTHILVTVGSATFVIAGLHFGMSEDGLSRIIQGVVTGIGFIGAGTILKRTEKPDIRGLTTSAGIWMAAAIGVAAGLGAVGLAIVAAVITFLILRVIMPIEKVIAERSPSSAKESEGDPDVVSE